MINMGGENKDFTFQKDFSSSDSLTNLNYISLPGKSSENRTLSGDFSKLMEEAFKLGYDGKFEEALEKYEQAKLLNTEDPMVWIGLGKSFLGKQDNIKAYKYFQRAIELEPTNTEALYFLGDVNLMLKNYLDSMGIFNKLMFSIGKFQKQKLPYFIEKYTFICNLCLKYGITENFSENIDKLIELDNANSALWITKGKLHFEKKEYDSAIFSFQKAVSYDLSKYHVLVWKSYVEYLNAELYFSSNKMKYQDILLSIVRQLEDICRICDEFCQISEDNNHTKTKLSAIYFISYCYYRMNDLTTAKEKLVKINELNNTNDETNFKEVLSSASVLLNMIHENHVSPVWWNWWLDSSVYSLLGFYGIISTIIFLFLVHPFLIGSANVNITIYIFFMGFLIFILLSPSIKKFKAESMEFEFQNQPLNIISLGKIEDSLDKIEYQIKTTNPFW